MLLLRWEALFLSIFLNRLTKTVVLTYTSFDFSHVILNCANSSYFPKVLFFLIGPDLKAKTFSGIVASKIADGLSGNTGKQEMDDMQ